MVGEIDLNILQGAGVLGTIAIGMGILLRWMVQKNAAQIDVMIQRSFTQSDVILDLAKTTISANTESLEKLTSLIMEDMRIHADHIRQKESIKEQMKECKRDRDQKLDTLLKKNGRG